MQSKSLYKETEKDIYQLNIVISCLETICKFLGAKNLKPFLEIRKKEKKKNIYIYIYKENVKFNIKKGKK